MDKVDAYIQKKKGWEKELILLREIAGKTKLEETIKWGTPVYALDGKNIFGLAAFKNYVGIWFFQGVFLSDPHQLLEHAQEDGAKAMRQVRFNSIDEIDGAILLSYFNEAIQNQKDGKELKPQKTKSVDIPAELITAMKSDKKLKAAFEKLTPGKQKDYANHITEAKREATKMARLEKVIPMIIEGVGLHDKYKNC